MEIIRYFCIVKRFNCLSRTLCLAVFIFLTAIAHADNSTSRQEAMDSVKISLLTCSPGTEIWSLYGHTAIRLQDLRSNEDIVINYGLFDFNQDNFILRFVFGITDYRMGIEPFQMFMMEYARRGRSVVQQDLHISPEDKTAIMQALYQNYEPQNRIYRYNYFYDNCTSRAGNILTSNLAGKVEYAVNPSVKRSYREMIHEWNADYPWARFGKDLLLGVKADAETEFMQQLFLPDSLRKAFDSATVIEPNGRKHPLVDSTFTLLAANKANVVLNSSIWDTLSPTILFTLIALGILLLSIYECRRKKTLWIVDVALLTLNGLAGLVLFAMIFSQHPTVSLNLQILMLNPLSILFVYSVGNHELRGKYHWYWNVLGAGIILFFIGVFFQNYAEGTTILACTLLLRVLVNRYIYRRPLINK